MELCHQYIHQLKKELLQTLPGESSHRKMIPPGREQFPSDSDIYQTKNSSVLVLFYPKDNELFLCLIKRPGTMKHHAGQIAFPGGKVEETDLNVVDTALREANEEVGLDREKVTILGTLSNLFISASNFYVTPVVAWASSQPSFQIDPNEVDNLIHFPINKFLTSKSIQKEEIETYTGKITVACIKFEGETIWGATAMILSELIDVINRFY